MPPQRPQPGSPADWLARARSSLVLAQQAKPDGAFWEDLCFQAQQAAEKALKAVLISLGISFPWTHSIEALLDLMPPGVDVPDHLREAARLTDYATTSRYPGDYVPVAQQEYLDALRQAEAVVAWAEHVVGEQAGPEI
jgi:HEPN domain-containing protein